MTQFTGSISASETYTHRFTQNLVFQLTPLKGSRGWIISIHPEGSSYDWSYPVNFRLRTGESQLLGSGYGMRAEERMKSAAVRFVLNAADFAEYSRLADDALESPRPEAAGEYIRKAKALPTGLATLKVLDYGRGEAPDQVTRMNFSLHIVLPDSASPNETSWEPVPCPAASPHPGTP